VIDSVLLDTSGLITLCDPNRPNHEAAKSYYREFIQRGTTIFLSTIVISEFQVKQPIQDLELRNFVVLPFNIDHAMACGLLMAGFERDKVDDRVRIKDDFKVIAQCQCEGISHLLTEDTSSLVKYLGRVRQSARCQTQALTLVDGFDASVFENGQRRLLP
jgi:hypothetical protein